MYGGEEATPFPAMTEHSQGTESQPGSRSESEERDATEFFGQTGEDQFSPTGGSGVHPGDGGIFNFSSEGQGPVRLTNLKPISQANEDVYSSPELRSNPQPPISVLSPTRQTVGSVGYPFLFTPSNHHSQIFPIPENEKYKKLVLKKQKREGRKDKNVTVFQAQEVAGHNYD